MAGASLSWRVAPRLTFSASGGLLLSGTLQLGGSPAATLRPSPFGAVAATLQLLGGHRVSGLPGIPFATATLGVGILVAKAADATGVVDRFTAVDARASAIAGTTFWSRFSPYLGAALFGGPVSWGHAGGITGTDTHHYQLLLGATVAMPAGFDLFIEGSPIGEQTLSGGAGLQF